MLRASAHKFEAKVALRALTDAGVELGVADSRELLAAADAAVLRDVDEIEVARSNLVSAVGEQGAVRAFATAGNFEMMNRLLDALGVGPPDRVMDLAAEIGVVVPNHFAG